MVGKHVRRRLGQEHIAAIDGLLQTNPGISLHRLTQLVAGRLGMPDLAYATLRAFMDRHSLQILPHQRGAGLDESIGALPALDLCGPVADVRVYRSIGVAQSVPPVRVDANASTVDQARQKASDWLDMDTVTMLARTALLAARRKSLLPPDPDEFDPAHPETWYVGESFAEDVADLFRLGLFRVAASSGIEGADHQVEQMSALQGAQWIPGAKRTGPPDDRPSRAWGGAPESPSKTAGTTNLTRAE